MRTPTLQQIEACAEWWAVRTFDHLLNQNNGDDSPNGGMTFMLMNMLSMDAKEKAPTDARDKFKASLIEQLTSANGNYSDSMLYVDYHPDEKLSKACDVAGISSSMIPIKSHTQWDSENGKFIGRYQYGGKFEDVSEPQTQTA